MRVLQNYIGKTILQTIGIVLVLLIGLQIFISFSGELEKIGQGDYGVWQAFVFALFSAPKHVYTFAPIVCLIGSLLGLGTLASHSELVVMRAGGVSIRRIIWTVIKTALVVTLIITLVGEYIAPKASHIAETRRVIATSGGQALRIPSGVWLRDANDFIYIRNIEPGGKLRHINRYRYDDQHRLLEESYAKSADYQQGRWTLHDVSTSYLSPNKVDASFAKDKEWDIGMKPTLFAMSAIDPAEMSLPTLFNYVSEQKANNLDVAAYEVALWKRIYQPLATCVMMFLAIPFIFGPLSSATLGFRLLAGITTGFAFYILNQFFGPMSLVYQIPVEIGTALPTIIIALAAYALMRRTI